jgi:hypothetical protein
VIFKKILQEWDKGVCRWFAWVIMRAQWRAGVKTVMKNGVPHSTLNFSTASAIRVYSVGFVRQLVNSVVSSFAGYTFHFTVN